MTKLYERTEDGGIIVKDGRSRPYTQIPNYVIDLYTPIVGVECLGAYMVYCRLGGYTSRLNSQTLAQSLRISTRTLANINEKLEKAGLITVEKPTGAERLKHKSTTITALDPPTELTAENLKSARASGFKPLTAWLIEPSKYSGEYAGIFKTDTPAYSPEYAILEDSYSESESIIKKGVPVMESCGTETKEPPQPQTPPEKALTAASQVFFAQLDQAHAKFYGKPYAGPRVDLADEPDLVVLIPWSVGDIALLLNDALAAHQLQIGQPMDTWPSYKLAIMQVLAERAKTIADRAVVGQFTANLVESMNRHGAKVSASDVAWSDREQETIVSAVVAGIPIAGPTAPQTLDYALDQWVKAYRDEPFSPNGQLNWLIKVANNRAVQVLKSSGRNGQNGATSNARNGNGRATANRNGSGSSTPRQQTLSIEDWQRIYDEHERHMRGDD